MSRTQFKGLPTEFQRAQKDRGREVFLPIAPLFEQGRSEGVFKSLPNETLAGLSIETCITFAHKHLLSLYLFIDETLEATIATSWDVIAIAPAKRGAD